MPRGTKCAVLVFAFGSRMGRKKDLSELGKRGPGRKAKKQQPPELPARVKERASLGVKKLGGRSRLRSKRRAAKLAAKVVQVVQEEQRRRGKKLPKVADLEEVQIERSKQEKRPEDPEDLQPPIFSDENFSWLKPVDGKKVRVEDILATNDDCLEKNSGT